MIFDFEKNEIEKINMYVNENYHKKLDLLCYYGNENSYFHKYFYLTPSEKHFHQNVTDPITRLIEGQFQYFKNNFFEFFKKITAEQIFFALTLLIVSDNLDFFKLITPHFKGITHIDALNYLSTFIDFDYSPHMTYILLLKQIFEGTIKNVTFDINVFIYCSLKNNSSYFPNLLLGKYNYKFYFSKYMIFFPYFSLKNNLLSLDNDIYDLNIISRLNASIVVYSISNNLISLKALKSYLYLSCNYDVFRFLNKYPKIHKIQKKDIILFKDFVEILFNLNNSLNFLNFYSRKVINYYGLQSLCINFNTNKRKLKKINNYPNDIKKKYFFHQNLPHKESILKDLTDLNFF